MLAAAPTLVSRTGMPGLPAAPEVGYYGELDPFAGGISAYRHDLPRLVRELLLFLLVKDVVLLSPGNLLEHSLTLPACEALAPFVRAGRLTTSAASSVPRPGALIDERAQAHVDGLRGSARRTADRARRSSIAAIVDRWHAVLPDAWSLTRDVPAQIAGFAQGILHFCDHTPRSTPATTMLRHAIAERVATRRSLGRDDVLAQVSALRESALPRELARLVFVVQAMFFKLGSESHSGCTLYPGAFARLAARPGISPDGALLPPIDWDAHPTRVGRRLRRLGIEPARLLSLPTAVLLEVARSAEWRAVRELLRGEPAPPALEQAVAACFRDHDDPLEALPSIHQVLAPLVPVPRLPEPWQLAVSATLGLVGLHRLPAAPEDVTLDLVERKLVTRDHGSAPLTAVYAHVLMVLAAAGESGLAMHDLMQLSLDVGRIEAAPNGRIGDWAPYVPKASADPRAGAMRTLLHRVNHELAPFGLLVAPVGRRGGGRFAVVDERGQGRRLRLRGSLWTLLGTGAPPPAPAGLSSPLSQLWGALADAAPQPLTVQQLATSLGKPNDAMGLKQTTEAATRLGRKLVALDVPWRVIRLRRGLYALMPRRTEPDEVR